MIHLAFVLLFCFALAPLAESLLRFMVRLAITLICLPFVMVAQYFYFWYRLIHEFSTTGGAREFVAGAVICLVVMLLLSPFFPI